MKKVVSEVERLHDLLKDTDETGVTYLRFINDDIVKVWYKDRTDFDANARVNVVIAEYTTCHARLRLNEILHRLEERVLYYDTDSVMYISRTGKWDPPVGDYLRDLANEIDPKDCEFITSFCTGGPQNYAYKLDSGKRV